MIQERPQQSDPHIDGIGSLDRPIGILDDEEEKSQFNYLLEESRNQNILKQAYLCRTSLEITFAIIKTKFRGSLLHKEEALKKVISKYFLEKLHLDIFKDFFTQRLEANYDNPETKPTGLGLIIYGVDFMDTKRVGNMFNTPGFDARPLVHKITWINDSCCQVTFFSPQNAQLALEHMVLNISQYKIKAEEDGGLQLPKDWFELKPYDIYSIQRRLFARYTTLAQLELQKSETPSRYIIFENAQRGLELHLLSIFNAFEDYQKITNLIEFENYKKSVFRRLNSSSHRGSNRLSNDLLNEPLKNYFKQKKTIDLEQEPRRPMPRNSYKNQDNILNESIIAEPENIESVANGVPAVQPTQGVQGGLSPEGQRVNQALLQELEKENNNNAMVEEVDQSYIMVDESEQPKVAVEPPKSQLQPVQNSQNHQQPILVNQDVTHLLAPSTPNQTQPPKPAQPEKLDKCQLSSQQISVSIVKSTKPSQEQSASIVRPVQTNPGINESKPPTQDNQPPLRTNPVQEISSPVQQSQSVSHPPKSTPVPEAKPVAQMATSTPKYPPKTTPPVNKGRVLPASRNDHYEPDSY